MKHKFLLFTLLLVGSLFQQIHAQGIFFETVNGEILSKQIESVGSVTFPNHNLVVNNSDNTTNSFSLLSMKKIHFDASSVTIDEDSPVTQTGIAIYPNPANDIISLVNLTSTSQSAYIYSAQGKLLLETLVSSKSQHISLEAFPAGLYFLRIENQTIKFIKL